MAGPQSLPEWATYVAGLEGHDLYSKLVAANSQTFAQTLLEEGMSMKDVEQVLALFVRQCQTAQVPVPFGGAFDLHQMTLTQTDIPFSRTASESGTTDVLDEFLLRAAFRD